MKQVLTLFFGILLAAHANAGATQTSTDFSGPYTISFLGMHMGKGTLSYAETENTYQTKLVAESSGLVGAFITFVLDMKANGVLKDSFPALQPLHSHTKYNIRNQERERHLMFTADGSMVERKLSPPEPDWKRPAVPQDLQNNTLDYLSMVFAVRRMLQIRDSQHIDSGTSFSIPLYDAKRRTDAHIRVVSQGIQKVAGKKRNVIELAMSRTAVAGLNEGDVKRLKDEGEYRLIYSADSEALPLLIELESSAGKGVIVYDGKR